MTSSLASFLGRFALIAVAAAGLFLLPTSPASAAPSGSHASFVSSVVRTPDVPGPTPGTGASSGTVSGPTPGTGANPGTVSGPTGPKGPSGNTNDTTVSVDLTGLTNKPSTSVTVIVAMTLLSLLPAILLTCTSFTKILVVLGLTRNALGLQQTPPNQVLAGLALFLSLFIMAPVLSSMNDTGVQPYLNGTKTSAQAYHDGVKPLKSFMLDHTNDDELTLLTNVAKRNLPKDRNDVSMATLVPAFVLSELKQAFIIGFIIFIPFLVIDIVVSGALMALGMMMMPPVMVSLPFKLLLFVLVDGWALVIKSLVASYAT
jgi:flagellar biosynthetic protein FliP